MTSLRLTTLILFSAAFLSVGPAASAETIFVAGTAASGVAPGRPAVTLERHEVPATAPGSRAGVVPNAGGPTSPWTRVGPVNQPGRTRVAALDLSGFNLYVGSDEGGLWQGYPFGDAN